MPKFLDNVQYLINGEFKNVADLFYEKVTLGANGSWTLPASMVPNKKGILFISGSKTNPNNPLFLQTSYGFILFDLNYTSNSGVLINMTTDNNNLAAFSNIGMIATLVNGNYTVMLSGLPSNPYLFWKPL